MQLDGLARRHASITHVGAATGTILVSVLSIWPAQAAHGRPVGTIVASPATEAAAQASSSGEAVSKAGALVERREEDDVAVPAATVEAQSFDVDARLAVLPKGAIDAVTYTVNHLGDSGVDDASPGDGVCADASGRCGLRTAVQEANARPGLDIILLPAGTVTLATAGANEELAATGDLDVTDPLIVRGAGAALSFVDGNGGVTGDRVFHVRQTGEGPYVTADFVDLSISGGNVPGSSGGGIFAGCRADVVVRRSNIFGNFGALGGGLALQGSGCFAGTLPRLLVYGSAVYDNTAASSLAGGGIDLFSGGTLSVINSTVAENTNTATSATAIGGISVSSNTSNNATIRSSTIVGNGAPNATTHDGVGLRLGASSTATLIDNLIGFNTFNSGLVIANCGGSSATITSGGGNVYGVGTVTCPVGATDITNAGPTLSSPLAFTPPGQTPTAAIGPSSAARASGRSCILAEDQRGAERPLRACSSGAFQFIATPPPPEIFANGFE